MASVELTSKLEVAGVCLFFSERYPTVVARKDGTGAHLSPMWYRDMPRSNALLLPRVAQLSRDSTTGAQQRDENQNLVLFVLVLTTRVSIQTIKIKRFRPMVVTFKPFFYAYCCPYSEPATSGLFDSSLLFACFKKKIVI